MMSAIGGRIGQRIPRVEDQRLLTGAPSFVSDLPEARGALHVAILRAPCARADVLGLQVERARQSAGVAAVLAPPDLAGVNLPCDWFPPGRAVPVPHPVLAGEQVAYHGQPMAAVAAETREAALDALDALAPELEALPAVLDQEQAISAEAPQLHPAATGNLGFRYARSGGDVDAAFARADLTFSLRLINNRVAAAALEGRAVLSRFDRASGHLEHWSSTQLPHVHARALAGCLDFPFNRLRFRVPSVGGGFGAKLGFYAEDVICAMLALRTGRACRWTEDRAEGFLATTHGRDHIQYVDVAARGDGRILGLRARLIADLGAYAMGMGPGVPAINAGHSLTGPYDIQAVAFTVEGVYTNRTPTGPYRGAGHPEATYLIERVVDAVGARLGLDPIEVRRRNLVASKQMPYRLATGLTLDSGDYQANLEAALKLADYDGLCRWREQRRQSGLLAGVGVAMFSEGCGAAPSMAMGAIGFRRAGHESARVVVHPDGRVSVFSGAQAQGQGHQTSLAQIAGDALGVPLDHVEVIQGDVSTIPFGTGTFNSRSIAVGGSAVWRAAERIARKMRRIAAYRLGGRPEQVELADGVFRLARRSGSDGLRHRVGQRVRRAVFRRVTGIRLPAQEPPPSLTFAEVAEAAHLGHDLPLRMPLGLDETEFFDPRDLPFAYGSHVAAVEIDPATGHLGIAAYCIVDDAGRLINPLLVEGQMHGGSAQGIGQALFEHLRHDATGQGPIGGFRDYAVPRASDLPRLITGHTENATRLNPLGAKGVGEGATIGAPPALVTAALDALRPRGIEHIDMPLTPENLWQALAAAKETNP